MAGFLGMEDVRTHCVWVDLISAAGYVLTRTLGRNHHTTALMKCILSGNIKRNYGMWSEPISMPLLLLPVTTDKPS